MTIAYLQRMVDQLKAELVSSGVDYWKVEERIDTILFFITYLKEHQHEKRKA